MHGVAAVLAVFVIALAAAMLARMVFSKRPSAEELEHRRRDALNAKGKLGDGEVLDVENGTIVFSYSVRGVGYTAAQDVSALAALLPSDAMSLIGPASVKFDPRNPANSIVLCEAWSGLRDRETNARLA